MSTLQWSLAIIGGLVLAALVAYNAWTLRRNAPRRAQTFSDADKDPHPRATAADSGALGNEGTGQGAALAGEPDLRLEPVLTRRSRPPTSTTASNTAPTRPATPSMCATRWPNPCARCLHPCPQGWCRKAALRSTH